MPNCLSKLVTICSEYVDMLALCMIVMLVAAAEADIIYIVWITGLCSACTSSVWGISWACCSM